MVWYNYRRVPAVTLLHQLIGEGKLGRIFHYRAKFLQDWTISQDLPQGGEGLWRLDVNVAGSGVTGDLLAHCIDTALWLNGPIAEVTAMTETFIKQRKHNLTGKVEPVGIDDASAFLARFQNGSLSTFEATRYARGHKALYTLEINGEHASACWDLHDLHRLQWFDHKDEGRTRGWRSVHVTRRRSSVHEELVGARACRSATSTRSPTSLPIFCRPWARAQSAAPTFRDGLQTDYVTDAVLKSAASGRWEQVGAAETGRSRMMMKHTDSHSLAVVVIVAALALARSSRRRRDAGGAVPRGAEPLVMDDPAGFQPIFDGKTLNGWDGDPAFWKVADGAIVGESTPDNAVKENTFLIWRGGEPQGLRAESAVPHERHQQRHSDPQRALARRARKSATDACRASG